jgi:probable HAF family extracellular repeat protein
MAAAGLAHGTALYTIVDLGPFSGAAPVSNSNASGQIAGGDGHAIVTSGATTIDLGVLPGGSWSAAYGINGSGEVTGYGDTSSGHFRGFTWTAASGMTMLGTLGGLDSYGMAIDDSGEVAGHSSTSSGYIHAFVSTGNGLADLGTLGGTSSYAYGIDNAGAVVGYSTTFDGSQHAFVYSGGAMLDLNGLISASSGWVLNAAYSIDGAGRIVGTGMFNGANHEFRLDPLSASPGTGAPPTSTPETSTIVSIGLGLAALGRFRFRRRSQTAAKPLARALLPAGSRLPGLDPRLRVCARRAGRLDPLVLPVQQTTGTGAGPKSHIGDGTADRSSQKKQYVKLVWTLGGDIRSFESRRLSARHTSPSVQ